MNCLSTKLVVSAGIALSIGLIAFAQPAAAPKNPEPRGQPERAPESPTRGEPGTQRRNGPGGPGGPNAGNPTNLEGAMKLLNGNLKRLKSQVADSTKKSDNLRIVNEAQRGAVIAKGMDTGEAFAKETDPAKKAKMGIDFRRKMIELVEHLITLEKQILDDKLEDAAKTLELLKAFREENHKAFGVED